MKRHNERENTLTSPIDDSSKNSIDCRNEKAFVKSISKICCIGAGYVGGTTCATIAYKAPEIQCTVVDINKERIDAWNSENLPIFEPNLEKMVNIARDGHGKTRTPNLFFSTTIGEAIKAADAVFISVDTPTKKSGLGAGSAADLRAVESAARSIAKHVSGGYKIIVEKSTVPCKTAETIKDIIMANTNRDFVFDILSNPEFLAEGTAVNDLLYPDRVLIGSLQHQETSKAAAKALASVYLHWIPRERIIFMNLWSSELAKLASNAFLAQRISSIKALSAICEATEADVNAVSHAVGLDNRIGSKMLQSSVGFGGSCFKKDILNLVYLSESLHLPQVASYWRSIIEINEWQKNRFTKRIIQQLYGSLSQKRIAVLGFAYKKNTADTRESASITLVSSLVAEGALVAIYDPQVEGDAIHSVLGKHCKILSSSSEPNVTVCQDAYSACKEAQAVVLMTDWDEFGSDSSVSSLKPGLDWEVIATLMKRPMNVFDGRNIVNRTKLKALGFRVFSIGRGETPN